MPDDKAQVILRDLVVSHGPFSSSDDDRRRCRGLLLDLAGGYRLEVNLILRAQESGAPEQLAAGRPNLGLVTPRLVRELQETHGISAENAAWAVAAWGVALGLQPAVAEPARRWHETLLLRQLDIEMMRISAGDFFYGDEYGDDDQHHSCCDSDDHRVYLAEYWAAKTPVTNWQYEAFVNATGHRTPNHWKGGNIPAGKEDHPVVYVSWEDAAAFCDWVGLILPTEHLWEKAARGTDGRTYPWGEAAPDKNRCNFNKDVGDTTPVDKYPAGASPYGLLDMAGNVWEWCQDWYISEPKVHVLRGGSWVDDDVRSTLRTGFYPSHGFPRLGFPLCAYNR